MRTLRVGSSTYNPARVQQIMAGSVRAAKIAEILEACWHRAVIVEPQALQMVVFVDDKCGKFKFSDGDDLEEEKLPVFYRDMKKEELAEILFWKSERDSVYQPFRLCDVEEVIGRGLKKIA